MDTDLAGAGLGLDYMVVRLVRVRPEWHDLGVTMIAELGALLGDRVVAVEHMGSTSVPGLLAKPILDFAVGTRAGPDLEQIREPLEAAGWTYRGDAGDDGGLVFVLESRPQHRVAHLHAVLHDGRQWRGYLALRELLRRDPAARARYETTKLDLAAAFAEDGRSYTNGKHETVEELLRGADPSV